MAALTPSSEILKITFCNVGQGDAILISLSTTQMLVDGGPDSKVLECLNKQMPMADKTIEMAVITHPDQDHMGGMIAVLQNYQVSQLATIPVGKDTLVYQKFLQTIQQYNNITISNLFSGDRFRLGKIQATVIWPERFWVASRTIETQSSSTGLTTSITSLQSKTTQAVLGAQTNHSDVNDFSIVLHLKYGNFDLLLNGDAEAEVQDEQLQTNLVPQNIEVMSEPHHGSRNGLLDEWLSIVSPELAVISVGANNRYGHPVPEITSRLQNSGVRILRTDQRGDIVVETDGQGWWIKE
jgi:competence protein ComEC